MAVCGAAKCWMGVEPWLPWPTRRHRPNSTELCKGLGEEEKEEEEEEEEEEGMGLVLYRRVVIRSRGLGCRQGGAGGGGGGGGGGVGLLTAVSCSCLAHGAGTEADESLADVFEALLGIWGTLLQVNATEGDKIKHIQERKQHAGPHHPQIICTPCLVAAASAR